MKTKSVNAVESETTGTLPRVLGLFDVINILIGNVVGSGIFLVSSAIALKVESPLLLLLVWIVGGTLTFFGSLSFAELSAAYPQAGGMYVFLREAYGRMVAFLFGWTLFFVIDTGAIATLAVAFSSKYLPYFFPDLSFRDQKIIALLLIALPVTVNYIGVRSGAGLQNVLTVIKYVAMIGIAFFAFTFAKGNFSHFITPAIPDLPFRDLIANFGVALVASLWAYKGWEATTFTAGETKNPQRNLPLGFLIGIIAVLAGYLVVNLCYLYVFPTASIATSDRIAADVMQVAVGSIGASIVTILILISITGTINGIILTSPRVYYAMARDGLFFRRIAQMHPRFKTPHYSVLATGLWSAVLSLSGNFEQLFTYVVFGQWIFFGLTVTAVFILRRKQPHIERPYRVWGYPFTTILFVMAAIFIALNTLINQFTQSITGLGIILAGLPAYLIWNHLARSRQQASHQL